MDWKKLNLTWHYVEKWAEETPEAEALVFEQTRLTWSDFKKKMDLTAKAFLEAGVGKGDRIAMLSTPRTEFLIVYMAAHKIGAMFLGLNPKFTADELRFQMDHSAPALLVTIRDFLGEDITPLVETLMKECPSLRKTLVMGDAFKGAESFAPYTETPRPGLDAALEERASSVCDTDSALLMYTSGSTGKPKGVVHTQKSIIENIRVEIDKFHFSSGKKGLLHLPINHVAADVEIGYGVIMAGGCLVCMDRFDPMESLKLIEKEKIHFFGQVPVMFLLQIAQPAFKEIDLSGVESFIWAGSSAPKVMLDVLSGICRESGAELFTGYGSTETCGFITYTEKGDDIDTLLGTAGKIAPPFELKIVDDERGEIPDGEVGEIAVRGAFMFREYFNNPEATADVLDKDGWYYTTDLAFKDERGYIHITGRKSEMFKTGGENVYPREVEEVIESHDAVLFAAVMGAPDDIYQEVGWAFVMPKPGSSVTEEELRDFCRPKLANFKLPKKFIIRPLLPLMPTGKVNKLELKSEIKQMLGK